MSKEKILADRLEKRMKEVRNHKWQVLNLSDCGLDEIPDEVFTFTHLVRLNLSTDVLGEEDFKNKIERISSKIVKLINLKVLNISNNKITEVPSELSNLKLVELCLENNNISMFPLEIAKMSTLNNLNITKNPLINVPPEIALRGIEPIRNFIKEYEEEDYLYEVKLILVGEGRVGKTSLAKTLSQPNYALSNEVSTEGINVVEWSIPKSEFESSEVPNMRNDFRLNIWDFGGQEIYHSTHQFFLTKRSIYLLVTESRKEDRHDDFYYWLNIIKLLGDKSPVIIVMNKCDQPTKELPISEYKKAFENLHDYIKVSCKDDHRATISVLRNEIKKLLKDKTILPHIGTSLPKKWVDVRVDIDKCLHNGNDFISYQEYLNICNRHYIFNSSAVFLSEFFHDLGVILHFKDDINLKDTVILNNQWVTKGVYKLLDNHKIIARHGIFTLEDIDTIWNEAQYVTKKKELISMMKNSKFELIFELENGKYLAPQLLPVDEIDYEWRTDDNNLFFEFKYKFMPKGILTRLIVKNSKDIYDNTYWRYGVLLSYENTRAIIREKYLENKITIQIEGENKKELLTIIRKTIHEINNTFNNIDLDEMIPCNCTDCKTFPEPNFFKYAILRRYQQRELKDIRCEKSLLNINIRKLLTETLPASEHNFNEQKSMTDININIQNNNTNTNTNENRITAAVQVSINSLVSDLALLKEELLENANPSEKKVLENEFNKVEPEFSALEEAQITSEVNKSSLSKIKNLIQKVTNAQTALGKIYERSKEGVKLVRNVGRHYNSIAGWAGLPTIPKVLVED